MSVRQEIHAFIDDITESKWIGLKPLLCALADKSIVIEADLAGEERAIVAKGVKEYKTNPGGFIPLGSLG